MNEMDLSRVKIAVIGLGYVGLPLALEFGKKYYTVGHDINSNRVKELQLNNDHTQEADLKLLQEVNRGSLADLGQKETGVYFTELLEDIRDCSIYIVTVPTPIDLFKAPDLGPLLSASASIGKILKKGDIVIYESTTYPGCTEEDCVPILEKHSGLKFNQDFFCGYSPERINPGDKINTLVNIKKVTSGSTPKIAEFVDQLYASIIVAGTHKAPNMRVAEASKAIENAQRDINISFVNELALIFDRMGVDTNDVLAAAGTKWNFLPFKPGLVGGHCIGVDPYYLAHKAESLGYYPEVILSGRRVNDDMGKFVANKLIKLMIQEGTRIKGARVLILGITFKENCPDIRNTRVVDIVDELTSFGVEVEVFDPWADREEVYDSFNLSLIDTPRISGYEGIILGVAHSAFLSLDISSYLNELGVVYDTKGVLNRDIINGRL